jgi:hypothetical protein
MLGSLNLVQHAAVEHHLGRDSAVGNRQAEQGALTGMFWTGPVRVLLAKASVV